MEAQDKARAPFRPPAIPLVTCDPYFSVWSMSDKLTDDWPRHWTGSIQAMDGMVRIDGKTYRIMGKSPETVPALPQTDLRVYPTRTIYTFEGNGVQIDLTFMTALLPYNLDIMSRPVTYLTWNIRSTDRNRHQVAIYYDNSAELVVNSSDQKVVWSRYELERLHVLSMSSQDQNILQKSGDDLRIDWGHLYAAVPTDPYPVYGPLWVVTGHEIARRAFVESGHIPSSDDLRMPRRADDNWPVMAVEFPLPIVDSAWQSRHLVLAYDDMYSIEFLNRKLRPYWRRNGAEAVDLLLSAERDYIPLTEECKKFDAELTNDLIEVGGNDYAALATLAFRQCLAAQELAVDIDGTPLLFPKENFSNGCISTVDVLYPASPELLLFNTTLLRASLAPVLIYGSSTRWQWPFAPHDLGTYPLANGQVYGGGEGTEEDQMPVEESGNMLLMIAAMAKIDGNADFAAKYWPALTKWADYLLEKGFDPENQLCTDDFAGHLAHNTNLSVKAILALGGYSMLCDMLGKKEDAAKFRDIAQKFALKWEQKAIDGKHYRLAFDKPDTWSQKYNLVWDKILGLNLFSPDIAKREVSFYLKNLKPYGLPLDNRKAYTKLDWEVWTATLAASSADFQSFMKPLYEFMNQSPSRVPLTDWYWTTDAKQVGFQARSVVGGVFVKMLSEPNVWKKWSSRAQK